MGGGLTLSFFGGSFLGWAKSGDVNQNAASKPRHEASRCICSPLRIAEHDGSSSSSRTWQVLQNLQQCVAEHPNIFSVQGQAHCRAPLGTDDQEASWKILVVPENGHGGGSELPERKTFVRVASGWAIIPGLRPRLKKLQ